MQQSFFNPITFKTKLRDKPVDEEQNRTDEPRHKKTRFL